MIRSSTASTLVCLLIFSEFLTAQQPAPAPTQSALASAQTQPASAAPSTSDVTKPRVFITDSESWETKGAAGGNSNGFGAASAGGARPQTAEVIKTFGERCPQVIVNERQDLSQYVVKLDHEGGKGYLRKDNKVAVFVSKTGDSIFSKSTMSLGGSVQDACAAIVAHWTSHSEELRSVAIPVAVTSPIATPAAAADSEKPKISVNSTPAGADIEVNGDFVGNTPSTVEVNRGKNEIKITKKGFLPWSRVCSL